jgi:hypothetical protein
VTGSAGTGDGPALTARSRIRLGDKGRERAIGVLQRAFAKGQLTKEEFEQRVEVASAARMRHDLRPVLEDLPEYCDLRANPKMVAFWLD